MCAVRTRLLRGLNLCRPEGHVHTWAPSGRAGLVCAFWTLPSCGGHTQVPRVRCGPCVFCLEGGGRRVLAKPCQAAAARPNSAEFDASRLGTRAPGGSLGQVCGVRTIPRCSGCTPVLPVQCGPCGDRGARWEGWAVVCNPHAPTLQPRRSRPPSPVRGRVGIGAPSRRVGNVCAVRTIQHCGGYTGIRRVRYEPCGDRGAQCEGGACVCGPEPPMLRPPHLSPEGP